MPGYARFLLILTEAFINALNLQPATATPHTRIIFVEGETFRSGPQKVKAHDSWLEDLLNMCV